MGQPFGARLLERAAGPGTAPPLSRYPGRYGRIRMSRRRQPHGSELLGRLLLDPAGQQEPGVAPSWTGPRAAPAPPGGPPGRVPTSGPARHDERSGAGRRFGTVLALACMAAGVALAASIGWFYWRSHTVGDQLAAVARADLDGVRSCATQATVGSLEVSGLLQAPAIGLTAPVVAGTGDPQLDVAVGHVDGSAWPGPSGTMVLAAHDVTWFSDIDHLQPGDTITFTQACRRYTYRVTSGQVVHAGAPVAQTSTATLDLVTCWPTDALFLTSQRYVLQAALTSAAPTRTRPAVPGSLPAAPVVPTPAALAAQGLTLADNDVPLGTLGLAGSPGLVWQQSERPLQDEAAVLSLLFGAERSAQQEQAGWWHQLAPSVPLSSAAPYRDATITGIDGTVVPTLDVDGDRLVGASVTAEPELAGGTAPGRYRLTMHAVVRSGTLVVTRWSMVAAG